MMATRSARSGLLGFCFGFFFFFRIFLPSGYVGTFTNWKFFSCQDMKALYFARLSVSV
jgi:hypothetical protein